MAPPSRNKLLRTDGSRDITPCQLNDKENHAVSARDENTTGRRTTVLKINSSRIAKHSHQEARKPTGGGSSILKSLLPLEERSIAIAEPPVVNSSGTQARNQHEKSLIQCKEVKADSGTFIKRIKPTIATKQHPNNAQCLPNNTKGGHSIIDTLLPVDKPAVMILNPAAMISEKQEEEQHSHFENPSAKHAANSKQAGLIPKFDGSHKLQIRMPGAENTQKEPANTQHSPLSSTNNKGYRPAQNPVGNALPDNFMFPWELHPFQLIMDPQNTLTQQQPPIKQEPYVERDPYQLRNEARLKRKQERAHEHPSIFQEANLRRHFEYYYPCTSPKAVFPTKPQQ